MKTTKVFNLTFHRCTSEHTEWLNRRFDDITYAFRPCGRSLLPVLAKFSRPNEIKEAVNDAIKKLDVITPDAVALVAGPADVVMYIVKALAPTGCMIFAPIGEVRNHKFRLVDMRPVPV